MILRDARPDEIDAILSLTMAIWSDGLDESAYKDYLRTLLDSAWARTGNMRFLVWVDEKDDRVVGALKLYRLSARLDEIPISVGGLGAIFTLPDERGRGHGADMVSRAHKIMTERGDAFSLLYSEIGAVYYARLGYLELDPHPVTIAVPGSGSAPNGPRRMHRSDIDRLIRLRQAEDAQARFAISRDHDYWKYLLARASYPTSSLGPEEWESRVMLDGSDGYLWSLFSAGGGSGQRARLLEFGESSPGTSLPVLLDDLFAEARRRGVSEIEAWIPPSAMERDPRLGRLITRIPSASSVPMWFPIDDSSEATMRRYAGSATLMMGDAF